MFGKLIFVVFCALALSDVSALFTQADPSTGKRYQTTLPYTSSREGQILVQARLSGGISGTFALDSGTNVNMITDALAKKMGLTTTPAVGEDGKPVFLGSKRPQMATIPQLSLDTFRIIDSPYIVVGQKLLADLGGQPVDGLLGAGIFTLYPTLFDMAKHQIVMFYPSPLTQDELRNCGMEGAVQIPVTEKGNTLVFTCSVNLSNGEHQTKQDLVIDTGSVISVISPQAAKDLQLTPLSENPNYPTFTGNITITRASLTRLSLGELQLNNILIRYMQNNSSSRPPSLGLDVLSHYRFLLDYNQKIMYLKPSKDSK